MIRYPPAAAAERPLIACTKLPTMRAMRSPIPGRLRGPGRILAVAFALSAATQFAAAQQPGAALDSAADALSIPFVNSEGVVIGSPRYSGVFTAYGQAPESTITQRITGGRGSSGGDHAFGYPALGLRFWIAAEDRAERDPPIASMQVKAPSRARTPQGLHVGMPLASARPIIESTYRVDRDGIQSAGVDAPVGALQVSRPHGDKVRSVLIEFRQGRLESMMFVTRDRRWTHTLWSSAVFVGGLLAVLSMVALAVNWVCRRRPGRLPRTAADPMDRPGARLPAARALGAAAQGPRIGGGLAANSRAPSPSTRGGTAAPRTRPSVRAGERDDASGGLREPIGWSLLVGGPTAVALGAAWMKTSVSWGKLLGLFGIGGGYVAAVLGAILLARSGHAGTAAVGKAAAVVLGAIFLAVWVSGFLD